MKKRGRTAAALALAVLPVLSGCLEQIVEIGFGGSYTLVAYNGQPLPFQTRPGNCLVELASGNLLLFTDDSFELSLETHSEGAGCAAEAAVLFPPKLEGTYTHDDFNIQFLHEDGTSSQAGFHGSAVSWLLLGATFDLSRF